MKSFLTFSPLERKKIIIFVSIYGFVLCFYHKKRPICEEKILHLTKERCSSG